VLAWLGVLARLGPDSALLVLTLGVLLIYVELNRPGWVVPGAVGLTAALFAVASMGRSGVNPGAGALVLDVAATLALVLGFLHLTRDAEIGPGLAVGCGLILGGASSILARIARRARANKGLD